MVLGDHRRARSVSQLVSRNSGESVGCFWGLHIQTSPLPARKGLIYISCCDPLCFINPSGRYLDAGQRMPQRRSAARAIRPTFHRTARRRSSGLHSSGSPRARRQRTRSIPLRAQHRDRCIRRHSDGDSISQSQYDLYSSEPKAATISRRNCVQADRMRVAKWVLFRKRFRETGVGLSVFIIAQYLVDVRAPSVESADDQEN